jgi:glycosyltransferase involved in cell wall biosynthesis
MKVLLCHNHYQLPGGEDECFRDEGRLLEAMGHEVIRFVRHNDEIDGMGRLEVARKTLWNQDTYERLRTLMKRERPAVMHCTNTFPLISPAAYYAARAENVAVVQALHNYRLLCPAALFLRDGRACEDCLGKSVPWPAVRHGCYRGSRAASLVVTALIATHRATRTWTRMVDAFYTPSRFTRGKYVEGGFPKDRIAVVPSFVDPDPGPGEGRGGYAAFVGRLTPEKGVATLLEAWSRLKAPASLKIIGDGPLGEEVKRSAESDPRIEWLGRRPRGEVLAALADAACLVAPSLTYETFGRTIIEAFAGGTPAVVADQGAMAELVDPGRTGLRFRPGDAADLAAKLEGLFARRDELAAMRPAARREYETGFTASAVMPRLLDVYDRALARSRRDRPGQTEGASERAGGRRGVPG